MGRAHLDGRHGDRVRGGVAGAVGFVPGGFQRVRAGGALELVRECAVAGLCRRNCRVANVRRGKVTALLVPGHTHGIGRC